MPSSHLILCRPLLLQPPIPPSIRVFSNESALRTRWPKYWSFSFSISPSKEHPRLISFRMDWLDLLAVQGTLKSLFTMKSVLNTFLSAQCSKLYCWLQAQWCTADLYIPFCAVLPCDSEQWGFNRVRIFQLLSDSCRSWGQILRKSTKLQVWLEYLG